MDGFGIAVIRSPNVPGAPPPQQAPPQQAPPQHAPPQHARAQHARRRSPRRRGAAPRPRSAAHLPAATPPRHAHPQHTPRSTRPRGTPPAARPRSPRGASTPVQPAEPAEPARPSRWTVRVWRRSLATGPATPAGEGPGGKNPGRIRPAGCGQAVPFPVLAANLDQDQLVSLHAQLGAVRQLAGRPELAPEGKQLADAVLDAAKTVRQDAARLAGLVDGLSDADAAKRRADAGPARRARLAAGSSSALADPASRPTRHDPRALVRSESAAAPWWPGRPGRNLRPSAIQPWPACQPAVHALLPGLGPRSGRPPSPHMATRAGDARHRGSQPADAAAMLLREARDYGRAAEPP